MIEPPALMAMIELWITGDASRANTPLAEELGDWQSVVASGSFAAQLPAMVQ
jgi:hypothetical protein